MVPAEMSADDGTVDKPMLPTDIIEEEVADVDIIAGTDVVGVGFEADVDVRSLVRESCKADKELAGGGGGGGGVTGGGGTNSCMHQSTNKHALK